MKDKLEKNSAKTNIKKILDSRIVSFIKILAFIAVCAGIGILISYIQHESDPTEKAVEYFRAFLERDYDRMYTQLYNQGDFYIDKDMYIKQMKKTRDSYNIQSYIIGEPEEEGEKVFVPISCVDSIDGTDKLMKVYIESERNFLSLIPDYYVDVEQMLVDNVSITTPKDYKLLLNGKEVSEDYLEDTSDKNQTYRFDKILNGNYDISATSKYCAVEKSEKIIKADTTIKLEEKNFTASPEYKKILEKNTNSIINQFYKAVRARKPEKESLLKLIGNDKKLKSKVKKLVKQSEEIVYPSGTKNIDKYSVTKFKIGRISTNIKYDKKFIVECQYEYSYTSATSTTLANSYVYKLSGKCKSEMTIIYRIEKDKVIFEDIKLKNKDKKD